MPVQPFDRSGITRRADGVQHYDRLPGSLVTMFREAVERDRHGVAVAVPGGRRLSFGELWERAGRVAGGLREAGVGRGDRVAIRWPNSITWVVAFLGIQLAGAVAVPVNSRLTDREASEIIDDSGASVVLTADTALPDASAYAVDDLDGSDVAAIVYTSGTTGRPKGAVTTHENFLTNIENVVRCVGLDRPAGQELRTLICAPLVHVIGCNTQLLVMLALGGTSVIMPWFEPADFITAVVAERVNFLAAVPTIYALALGHPSFRDADLSDVRWVSSSGAPIAKHRLNQLGRAFPNARVSNRLGLTETSSLATLLPHEYRGSRPGSVGLPAPVVDLRLDRSTGGGPGELLVRSASVVRGYWNNPGATAAAFDGAWLRTGDLAHIDRDGFTYLVGRLADSINRGGEKVFCAEVEQVLAGQPGVLEAAVMGLPDDVMGERVGAIVVPDNADPFDSVALVAEARRQLAGFKVPERVSVRRALLPRTAAGKVDKARLKADLGWD
jgi:long-chain acyl-CoA synthetase